MFSKSKINEPSAASGDTLKPTSAADSSATGNTGADFKSAAPKAKPPASTLSADLTITGNLKTSGDINIEGTVEGDIRAHLLTIGEGATVRGECIADDVVVNGRIVGTVRGLKVRLTSSARVEGDIIHKTIAIESGAHFEGSVQRQEDPLNAGGAGRSKPAGGTTPAAPAAPSAPAAKADPKT
ncbi:MAG: Integral membrane protein CcmA involved in cell shape determination [Rhodobacteraceae bacterium HLUCCA08]|nr:MAG: Integral membrane protein CcmA involved in cell shape determination [Rhodobacteraceae bacterium HLUCCA08]